MSPTETHPSGYTQYASGGEYDDASGVYNGHLRDEAPRLDRYVIDEHASANRQSRIPFTSLMPRQLKKSPGWEYLVYE